MFQSSHQNIRTTFPRQRFSYSSDTVLDVLQPYYCSDTIQTYSERSNTVTRDIQIEFYFFFGREVSLAPFIVLGQGFYLIILNNKITIHSKQMNIYIMTFSISFFFGRTSNESLSKFK